MEFGAGRDLGNLDLSRHGAQSVQTLDDVSHEVVELIDRLWQLHQRIRPCDRSGPYAGAGHVAGRALPAPAAADGDPTDSAPGALPVCADLQPGAPQALPAGEYALPMKIINRGHTGPVVMATHVTAPSGRVVYTRVEPLDLAPGRDKSAELRVPVPADWGEGLYPVYLTLSDPKTRRLLHQAMERIPVAGTVALTLESEKSGYRLGEEARLTLTASARAPWNGSLRLGIYDFRGRLLGIQEQPARLAAALEGARWSVVTADGDTLAATLGAGRVILCRESIDAAGNTNPELARWQRRFLAELDAGVQRPVAPPDLRKLLA
jgi:hypothetical protein